MKKFFYAALALMVAMTASMTLVSCNDDDDDDNNSSSTALVGTWYSVIGEGWEYDEGELVWHWKDLSATTVRVFQVTDGKETGKYWDEESDAQWTEVTFNADGTFTTDNEDGDVVAGKYSVAKDKLTLTVGKNTETSTFSFKDGQLLLESLEYDEDGNLEVREIEYFNKGAYPDK